MNQGGKIMRDYECRECGTIFVFPSWHAVSTGNLCPCCGSSNSKRLWPTAININGHGYKNNFEGNKK